MNIDRFKIVRRTTIGDVLVGGALGLVIIVGLASFVAMCVGWVP